MNSTAVVLGKIFALTRGDLDSAFFAAIDLRPLIEEHEFVRLRQLSSFWNHPTFRRDSLLSSTASLLAHFHAQSVPFVSLIHGRGQHVECWVGGPRSAMDRRSVGAAMHAALADCRIDERAERPIAQLEQLRCAAMMTGSPLVPDGENPTTLVEQIEKVIRGMQGRHWLFAIHAVPMMPMPVVRTINEVVAEIQATHATLLLKSSPVDEQDRLAQRYVALLEAKLRRYEIGRARGMWHAHLMLAAEDSSALRLGQALLHAAFSSQESPLDPIRCRPCAETAPTGTVAEPLTTEELAVFARFPQEEYPGYGIADYVRYGVDVPNYGADATRAVFTVGDVQDRGGPSGNEVCFPRRDLTRHALVVGITGSGKTKTCMSLLQQIWDEGRGVPFLVIESAKAEYRSLRGHRDFAALRVYTVADENVAPLRLNPFEFPSGVLVQPHIDYVKSLFAAAFVLYPPMPYVLEQSLQEIYEDRGWDLAQSANVRGKSSRGFPTLSDLAEKIPTVVDRMGYDERITMDVKAGLLARINQLRMGGGKGPMFDVRQSTNNDLLFGGPCILELRNLISDDEKAFLIGLVLIRLYEICESSPERQDGRLHHVTLIEEAHRLLRNTSTEQSADVANPRGRAIEVFANILSEIRAYGEGIMIAEQVPAKLAPDAIKNTNLKIVHRLLAEDDRQLIGKSIGLDDDQVRGLSSLATGHAVVFAEGLRKAVVTRVALSGATLSTELATIREALAPIERLAHPDDCPHCRGECGPCRGSRARVSDSFRIAFGRFVNTLRFAPEDSSNAYETLAQMHGSDPNNLAIPLHCVLARLADAECDRRGMFHGWPFETVDRLVSGLIEDLAALDAGIRLSGVFAAGMEEACSALPRPYRGCVHCRRVCHYRFDAMIGGPAASEKFRATLMQAPVAWEALVGLCGPATEGMPVGATKPRRETALCFGIQQLHSLGISAIKQEQLAARLARHLDLEP